MTSAVVGEEGVPQKQTKGTKSADLWQWGGQKSENFADVIYGSPQMCHMKHVILPPLAEFDFKVPLICALIKYDLEAAFIMWSTRIWSSSAADPSPGRYFPHVPCTLKMLRRIHFSDIAEAFKCWNGCIFFNKRSRGLKHSAKWSSWAVRAWRITGNGVGGNRV